MAESTLSLSLPDLRSETGRYLGYGTSYDDYDVEQKKSVNRCVSGALRSFYFSAIGPNGVAYQWSFLRPIGTLTTVADQWEYELPAECGGIEGGITFVTSSGSYSTVPQVGEFQIRDYRQTQSAQTGRPHCAAVRSKVHSGVKGQRLEIVFWPTPDAAYELEYRMVAYPNAITPESPWPYGGMVHAQTILQGCLAQAELVLDGTQGVQTASYREMLAASISADGQLQRPDYLGYNGDRSDLMDRPQNRRTDGLRVSYNGTYY